jgi:uncharacterized protein YjaZ
LCSLEGLAEVIVDELIYEAKIICRFEVEKRFSYLEKECFMRILRKYTTDLDSLYMSEVILDATNTQNVDKVVKDLNDEEFYTLMQEVRRRLIEWLEKIIWEGIKD